MGEASQGDLGERNGSLEELDKRYLIHPFTELDAHRKGGPRIIDRASGITLVDRSGREILDGASGLWCVNVGYGRHEIARAIHDQICRLSYFHSFTSMANEPSIRLAERVVELAPDNLRKIFFGSTGSDANDTQVKMVWYYNNVLGRPTKKKIIARRRAYHGVTVAAGSLSGLPVMHANFDLPIPQVLHTAPTYFYRDAEPGMSEGEYARSLAQQLDALIVSEGPETVAAFIAEPVMGAGGVLPPPQGYFQEVRKVLDKHDVLLIVDEVITGFGRLGRMFASDLFEIRPDLVTLAKGLTSGYLPMSASLVTQEIADVLVAGSREVGSFGHGLTYSAHPVPAAAALANLDIIEREDLVANAAQTGAYFQRQLRERLADQPLAGDVRGVGLMAGVELVSDRAAKRPFEREQRVHARVAGHCYEQESVIVRPLPDGHTLSLSPPLIITRSQVDELLERFARGLATVTDALVREGVLRPADAGQESSWVEPTG